MFIIHGVDYTYVIIPAVSAILLFALQYGLCARSKRFFVRALPFAYVLLLLILAALSLLMPGTGYLDLRDLVALLLILYALVCTAAILLARFVYKATHRKR